MVNEKTLKITELEILDKLLNPFVFDNGHVVNTKEDWNEFDFSAEKRN